MNLKHLCLLLTAAVAASGCVPRREPARPEPTPAPSPAPRPSLPAPAPVADWRDGPLTPGAWTYDAARSLAAYGTPGAPSFTLRCDRAARQVLLSRPEAAAGTMTVRTSSSARNLPATAQGATLAVNDRFLDEIAFTRGRFLVQTRNAPDLIIPAWPEPARVIEDCRG